MSVEFRIDLVALDELGQRLDALHDMTVPLQRIHQEMMRSVDLNFSAQGRPEPWKPLAPSTIAQRRAQGNDAKILMDTGRLRSSLQIGSSGNLYELTPDHVTFGTNVPYAQYQQEGTGPYEIRPLTKKALYWAGAAHPVAKVNHPGLTARPFMVVQDEDVETFGEIVSDWLQEVL